VVALIGTPEAFVRKASDDLRAVLVKPEIEGQAARAALCIRPPPPKPRRSFAASKNCGSRRSSLWHSRRNEPCPKSGIAMSAAAQKGSARVRADLGAAPATAEHLRNAGISFLQPALADLVGFPLTWEISMSAEQSKPSGPDLAQGVPLDDLSDGGMVGGHVGEEPVLLARRGDEFLAIGATCSHYGGPLAEGLLVDDTVRALAPCPLRACAAARRSARRPSIRYRAGVEQRDGRWS
jgi:hypothetical protein